MHPIEIHLAHPGQLKVRFVDDDVYFGHFSKEVPYVIRDVIKQLCLAKCFVLRRNVAVIFLILLNRFPIENLLRPDFFIKNVNSSPLLSSAPEVIFTLVLFVQGITHFDVCLGYKETECVKRVKYSGGLNS